MNITDAVFEIKKLNERIAYLEKAYKELHRDTTAMMGEDKERIKVLEDALNKAANILDDNGYHCAADTAKRAALEVKP